MKHLPRHLTETEDRSRLIRFWGGTARRLEINEQPIVKFLKKGSVKGMQELILNTKISYFDTCEEFAKEYQLGSDDLVLTNEYIFNPFFGKLNLDVKTIFQEKYGAGEPTDVMVEAIMEEAAKLNCKRIIAVGGGTVIDIAKVLAVASDDSLDDLYADTSKIEKKHKLIIIPTTCGTGSEVTNIAIINRTKIGTKMGLTSPNMFADEGVLIPELLSSLPYGVFATSSIDALVHAVESSLSPKATPYSKLFGYKAIEMILNNYKKMAADGLDERNSMMKDFLIASNFAGIAFGTAGCATVHAMAYPLGGTYHVAHGESNYAVFTNVLKYYMTIKQDGAIEELNQYMAGLLGCDAAEVYDKLDELLGVIYTKKPLHEYGVKEEDLPEFAKTVIETQQRLMVNSFIPMDEEQVLKIYKEAF